MTFTYDPSLGDDVSKVRSKLDDVDSTDYEFEDETIQAYLDGNSEDVNLASSELCKILQIRYLKYADLAQVDDIRLEFKDKAKAFAELAEDFVREAAKNFRSKNVPMYAGGITKSSFNKNRNDCSLTKPKFTKGSIFSSHTDCQRSIYEDVVGCCDES